MQKSDTRCSAVTYIDKICIQTRHWSSIRDVSGRNSRTFIDLILPNLPVIWKEDLRCAVPFGGWCLTVLTGKTELIFFQLFICSPQERHDPCNEAAGTGMLEKQLQQMVFPRCTLQTHALVQRARTMSRDMGSVTEDSLNSILSLHCTSWKKSAPHVLD